MKNELNPAGLLLDEAVQLQTVSVESAQAYEREADNMLRMVDRRLIEREDLRGLIGTNPIAFMRKNHQHHVGFMANVFRYSCFGLLANVLVWVYRSYRSHGFSTDYFPIELAAWREAVGSCLNGTEAAEIDKIYGWMMSHHAMIVEASEKKDAPGFDAVNAERCEVLVRYLLDGNYPAGVMMLRDYCRDATSLAGFYEDVLKPSLYEVGRMWEIGRINAADEHLATAVAERMIATAYVTMSGRPSAPNKKGSAVIATTPDEPHGVGVRMVADLLELKGWDVHFLGVNVPISDIVDLVRRVEPTFVGLSLVMPYNLRNMEQIIAQLRDDEKNRSLRVMVGSPVLLWDKDLSRRLGADAFAPDLRSALELAEGWRKLI